MQVNQKKSSLNTYLKSTKAESKRSSLQKFKKVKPNLYRIQSVYSKVHWNDYRDHLYERFEGILPNALLRQMAKR